ncbi:hypothetical protein PJ985_14090 [Streptomyces sp. ACA25]|uniref:protein-L-isoaspartate O-methyltransferase family protein n=1 Tax=Streptomyces sp. ACA25 TaxID=3022596 RepID=UPI00230787C3|nr:hypothetical protein [Streptomyces sp. ACA25]MDB1088699.1 hypothetical protein [Streptomyces sp. ACA25]
MERRPAGPPARRQHVTSVEVDPGVAEAARRALRAAGQSPRVVTGDGMRGVPDAAPFDRILATVGLRKIPSAWPAQVTPGGLIVAPWGTHYSNRDALVRLTVTGDGTAAGAFLRPLEFMKVRAQRLARPIMRTGPGAPVTDSTAPGPLPPEGTWHPFPFVAGLRIPRATHAVQRHEDGTTLWLYDLDGSAWASATHRTGDSAVRVRQVGRRRLWDELTAAHTWWTAHGAPGYQRLGLTVTPESTRAWLDTPDHSWPVG